ncbi:hypothetical protein HaLaN_26140 [Haematococcus lacustris]|uniref:Uncharacterized protein n=1 Tax=Haematococcus lacustris TaxID=44745 RepID=A0A6A0A5I1_HAELA|nr:hypothetical protein HaLaN_26140 [Haematococcus lacustris]
MRVCGLTLHPAVARMYQVWEQRWLAGAGASVTVCEAMVEKLEQQGLSAELVSAAYTEWELPV